MVNFDFTGYFDSKMTISTQNVFRVKNDHFGTKCISCQKWPFWLKMHFVSKMTISTQNVFLVKNDHFESQCLFRVKQLQFIISILCQNDDLLLLRLYLVKNVKFTEVKSQKNIEILCSTDQLTRKHCWDSNDSVDLNNFCRLRVKIHFWIYF